jgi:hypothetical protein
MANRPYLRKATGTSGGMQIQFLDGTATTPKKIQITGITSYPEVPNVILTTQDELFLDRGKAVGMIEGDDAVDFPEFTITFDVIDDKVSTGMHETKQFLVNKVDPADGTTPLVSLNTGETTIVDENGNDYTLSLTENKFLFKMEYLFDSSETGKAFGYSYLVYISGFTYSEANGRLQCTITGQAYSKGTEITALS